MKSMWQESTLRELQERLATLTPDRPGQWGILMYRHSDHQFRQFEV